MFHASNRTDTQHVTYTYLLQCGIHLLLLYHYYLHVAALGDFSFMLAASAFAMIMAPVLERTRIRSAAAFGLFLVLPWLVRAAALLVFRVQQGLVSDYRLDALNLIFDKNFYLSLPPLYVIWTLSFAALRRRGGLYWLTVARAAILLAIFWNQGNYHLTLYQHPTGFALVLAGYIILEIASLILSTRHREGGVRSAPSAGAPGAGKGTARPATIREGLSFLWVLIPLFVIFFLFLLGRYTEGSVAAGGGLLKPTLFRFDFADYINLESEISLNDDLVLLYRRDGYAGDDLLRRYVLSGYDPGRGFYYDRDAHVPHAPVTVGDFPRGYPSAGYRARRDVIQEYFLVNLDPSSLVSLDYPTQVVPYRNWNESSFSRIYRVRSSASAAGPIDLINASVPRSQERAGREPAAADGAVAGEKIDGDWLAYYTRYGNDQKIHQLALQITGDSASAYQKVSAIERYLRNNFYYSLKPGIALDGNQLHYFLFESQKGYCSYFAFAMSLMTRSLGIPSRVAVGFFVDPTLQVLGYYPVRADMAHAWVEVYFKKFGWINFDPTSQNPAPGEDFALSRNLDMDQLSSLLEEILTRRGELQEVQGAPPPPAESGVEQESALGTAVRVAVTYWYVTLALLYLGVVALVRGMGVARVALTRNPVARVVRSYRRSIWLLSCYGYSRDRGESVMEHAERLEADHALPLVGCATLYLKALYAPSFGTRDLVQFQEAHRALLMRVKSTTSAWQKIAVFLLPVARGKPEAAHA